METSGLKWQAKEEEETLKNMSRSKTGRKEGVVSVPKARGMLPKTRRTNPSDLTTRRPHGPISTTQHWHKLYFKLND